MDDTVLWKTNKDEGELRNKEKSQRRTRMKDNRTDHTMTEDGGRRQESDAERVLIVILSGV